MHLLANPIRSESLLEETFDIAHRFYASSSEPVTFQEIWQATEKRGDTELINKFNNQMLGYADNGGSLDVREEIAKLYGDTIGADNIVIFPGAQTGMTLSAQALLHEGDHAIIITPSYQSLEESAKLAGASITRVGLTPDNGWLIDVDAVAAAIQPNTRYIAYNDPHNPSGSILTLEIKKKLAALAEENDIIILADEVYRLLEHDASERTPPMADITPNALSLATMSKPWGAGGTGIGWVVCQDKAVIEKLRAAQHIYAVCFSRSGELQAIMTLRASDQILAKNMQIIHDNIALLNAYFADNGDLFEWVPPRASGTTFVKFKGPIDANQLALELKDAGILVFPPDIFDCADTLGQYFRIGYSRSTMPAALNAFKNFIESKRQSWGMTR